MSAPQQPKVLLLELRERTSAKGNSYLSGWLGKCSVIAWSKQDETTGGKVWSVYVQEYTPKKEGGR